MKKKTNGLSYPFLTKTSKLKIVFALSHFLKFQLNINMFYRYYIFINRGKSFTNVFI